MGNTKNIKLYKGSDKIIKNIGEYLNNLNKFYTIYGNKLFLKDEKFLAEKEAKKHSNPILNVYILDIEKICFIIYKKYIDELNKHDEYINCSDFQKNQTHYNCLNKNCCWNYHYLKSKIKETSPRYSLEKIIILLVQAKMSEEMALFRINNAIKDTYVTINFPIKKEIFKNICFKNSEQINS